jgi:tripartite-type tricarboxylate transporter receptor subunit TctC
MRLATILVATVVALAVAHVRPVIAAEVKCLTARLIVPWGAGSGTDLIFRAIADAANRAGAKPRLEVVNISGDEGVRGSREALRAPGDGCTLLAVTQSLMTSYISGDADFNWTAFAPVARLTRTPVVLGARPNAAFATVSEMLEAARSPEGITAGSTQGLASHFLFLLMADRTGGTFKPVFLDGARERLSALFDGKIDVAEVNQATAQRLVPDGLIKALAVTGPQRLPSLPEVPTLKEQGINLEFTIDRGVVLPKKAPKELIDQHVVLFERALQDPQVAALLLEHGTAAAFLAPKPYAGYWQDTFADWRRIAKAAGFYKQLD